MAFDLDKFDAFQIADAMNRVFGLQPDSDPGDENDSKEPRQGAIGQT